MRKKVEKNKMIKIIEKTCNVYDDSVELSLEDTRDNYIHHNALGQIGEIYLSNFGVLINPKQDFCRTSIEKQRELKLLKEFAAVFGTKEYNPLSGEYYSQILEMIKNGQLSSLGYTIKNKEEAHDDYEDFTLPKPRRHQ